MTEAEHLCHQCRLYPVCKFQFRETHSYSKKYVQIGVLNCEFFEKEVFKKEVKT